LLETLSYNQFQCRLMQATFAGGDPLAIEIAKANHMVFTPVAFAVLLGTVIVIAVAWGSTYLVEIVDAFVDPGEAHQFSAEEVSLALDELQSR
jgi:hypothetical protein